MTTANGKREPDEPREATGASTEERGAATFSRHPYYGLRPSAEARHVRKSWHRPPGRASDFRGWAVIVDGGEVSLHERCSDAYAELDAKREPRPSARSN